jgi:hypothetical protein
MAWSALLYHRYCLAPDFAIIQQAWYEITHGNFNPYDTVNNAWFWQNHAQLYLWPLGLLSWVWPHYLLALWTQDFGAVGAEAVAFTWICEMASRRRPERHAAWFAAAGLMLLIANPWTWQAISWDYHDEPVMAAFLMLLLRDLAQARRRAWAWVLLLLMCGDVAASYLIAAGLGTALTNRASRMRGLLITCAGALGFGVITLVHADHGSGHGLLVYSYLAGSHAGATVSRGAIIKGVLTHPLSIIQTLAAKSGDIWANLAPGGLVGFLSLALFPIIVVVLVPNNLWPGALFSAPGYQNFPLYVLVPAGTIAVLVWLHQRHRITALVLSCLLLAQALGWSIVWTPWVPRQWLRVPASTAATLAAVHAMIPPDASVVASQGVVGRFGDRRSITALLGPGSLPVHGETWFIVVPGAGIERESTASAMAFIGELAGPLGATLVANANGVWAFRWRPPAGIATVDVPGDGTPLEGWAGTGAAARAVVRGPVSDWHAEATGTSGYVADLLAWQVPTGRYLAEVRLATSGRINLEVWNDTGNVMLAHQSLSPTDGIMSVVLPVNALTAYQPPLFTGFWPFHVNWLAPFAGQRLEVRVWSPGDAYVSVYSADLAPAPVLRR